MVGLARDQGKYRRSPQASHRLHGLRAHERGALPAKILLAENYRQNFIGVSGKQEIVAIVKGVEVVYRRGQKSEIRDQFYL